MRKKVLLSIFFVVALCAILAVWKYKTSIPKNMDEDLPLATPKAESTGAPMECAVESEHVQLLDSEKCVWKCSSFLTAPTSERCMACKGVVVPQNCPMCPPLCRPSFWIYEKDKR